MNRFLPLLLALAVSCGSPATSAPGATPSDLDGEWRLLEGSGPEGEVPVGGRVDITMVVDGSEVSGISACNHYGGKLDVDGAGATFTGGAMTEMACHEPAMTAEARYHAALAAISSVERDGDTLTMEGDDVRLVYEPVAQPEPAPLEDTRWKLESLVHGTGSDGAVSSAPFRTSLELRSNGQLKVDGACIRGSATWSKDGDRIEVRGNLLDVVFNCGKPLAQADFVHEVLADGFTYRIEERSLWLEAGDKGLQFVAP